MNDFAAPSHYDDLFGAFSANKPLMASSARESQLLEDLFGYGSEPQGHHKIHPPEFQEDEDGYIEITPTILEMFGYSQTSPLPAAINFLKDEIPALDSPDALPHQLARIKPTNWAEDLENQPHFSKNNEAGLVKKDSSRPSPRFFEDTEEDDPELQNALAWLQDGAYTADESDSDVPSIALYDEPGHPLVPHRLSKNFGTKGKVFAGKGPSLTRRGETGRTMTPQELCEKLKWDTCWAVVNDVLYHGHDGFWEPLEGNNALRRIRELALPYGRDAVLSTNAFREVVSQLQYDPSLNHERPFAPPENVIVCNDAVIILTNEGPIIDEHDLTYECTYSVDVSVKNVMNPQYGAAFESYVSRAGREDPRFRTMVLELILRLVLNIHAKCFYMLIGYPNTGKSVLLSLLTAIVGQSGTATLKNIQELGGRFKTHFLAGKRLCVCDEIPNKPFPADGVAVLKSLCGRSPVNAEIKGGDEYSFTEKPLIVLGGNYALRFPAAEYDEGLLDRLVIIPFIGEPLSKEERSRDLVDCLMAELPYILSEAIKLFPVLANDDFENPTRMEIPAEFRPADSRNDYYVVVDYVTDHLKFLVGNKLSTDEIYEDFVACTQSYLQKQPFAKLLADVLKNTMPEVECGIKLRGGTQRGYGNVAFVT